MFKRNALKEDRHNTETDEDKSGKYQKQKKTATFKSDKLEALKGCFARV